MHIIIMYCGIITSGISHLVRVFALMVTSEEKVKRSVSLLCSLVKALYSTSKQCSSKIRLLEWIIITKIRHEFSIWLHMNFKGVCCLLVRNNLIVILICIEFKVEDFEIRIYI